MYIGIKICLADTSDQLNEVKQSYFIETASNTISKASFAIPFAAVREYEFLNMF